MIDYVIGFLKTQNISHVHLQVKGFNRIRQLILRKLFEKLKIIQFVDTTVVVFGKGLRRKAKRGVKRVFRPKGAIRVGSSRLRKVKPAIQDHVSFFGDTG